MAQFGRLAELATTGLRDRRFFGHGGAGVGIASDSKAADPAEQESMNARHFICFGVLLAAVTGCNTTPHYRGEGQIRNTSYWDDGVVHTTQYTIRLASFEMSANVQREFELGELSSWREPRLTVCVRFKDPRAWYHLAKSDAREARVGASENWQNIDDLRGRFGYQLSNQSGVLLSQPEAPLGEFNWGRGEFDREVGDEHEISKLEHVGTAVPKGSKLKLSVSYTGDPGLTNQADFVVLWGWR